MVNTLLNDDTFRDVLEVEGINARGFGTIPKLLMQDGQLTPEAKCIYAYFCAYAGSGRQAFPSVPLILKHLQMSEHRYRRHFRLLREFGYIKTIQTKTNGKYSRTVYTIVSNPVPLPQKHAETNLTTIPNPPSTRFEGTEFEGTGNVGTNINSVLKLTVSKNLINQSISLEREKEVEPTQKRLIDRQHATAESDLNLYRGIISDNIFLAGLRAEHDGDDLIDNIYELIVEIVTSKKEMIRIGGEDRPASVVQSTFLKLNEEHIRYVVAALRENYSKAQNIRAYTLTALYNAYSTMGVYYTNRVQHGLYGGKPAQGEPFG